MLALGSLQLLFDVVLWQRPRLLWPQNTGTNALLERFGVFGDAMQAILPPVRLGASVASLLTFTALTCALTLALLRHRSLRRQ
jgi:hypothetical protein